MFDVIVSVMVKQFSRGGEKVKFFKEVEIFREALNCFWRGGIRIGIGFGIGIGSSRAYFKIVEKFSEGIKDF